MNKGIIMSALHAHDKAIATADAKLSDVVKDATDDDILHAALYAATGGTGKMENYDSQAADYKKLRTTLRRYRGLTVKLNKKAKTFYIDKPGSRNDSKPPKNDDKSTDALDSTAPEVGASAPKTDTATGNRSKPAPKAQTDREAAAVEQVRERSKADQMAAIVRQMRLLGITIDELSEYIADQQAQQAEAEPA